MPNRQAQTITSKTVPHWLIELREKGFIPYIATSRHLLSSFNLKPFGIDLQTFVMEDQESYSFLEAYLLSNAISFKSPDYKMPNWVLVDCVLLQHGIVGFMKKKEELPLDFLENYKTHLSVNLSTLTHIPLSGEVDSQAFDGSFVNYSLFSLGKEAGNIKNLGLFTKLLSLETNRAEGKEYRIITQYDNPSLKIHGRISSSMEIDQAMVSLHPGRDMTMVLKMKIGYDAYSMESSCEPVSPTFWLNARDTKAKKNIQDGRKTGKTYIIAPPFSVTRNNEILLPIIERISAYDIYK